MPLWLRLVFVVAIWVFFTPFYYFCTLYQWLGSDLFEIQVAGAALSIVFFLIGSMTLVSIIATYSTEPGLVKTALNSASQVDILNMGFCSECGQPKPERAHHCKRARACYLRMDHYCHSLGIIIALKNHKPFIALLAWSVIQGFFSVPVDLASMFLLPRGLLYILFLMVHVVALVAIGASLADQLILIGRNLTFIEKCQKAVGKYDRGVGANFEEFFGPGVPVVRALIPTPSRLSGLEWSIYPNEQCL